MSLKGNLSSVNLTEIFQMLSLSGREGTLFIYEGSRKRAICFTKEGVSIRSRERNENLLIGKILVRLGFLDEEQLQQAVETRRSGDKLIGDVLVDSGLCSREEVEDAFRIQSAEEIQDLFLYRSDAQFEYVDEFFPETEVPYVNLNVNALLIEIARRTDEWEYIRRRIRGPREIYHFTGTEAQLDGDTLRECFADRIDPLIDGASSVRDIIERSYAGKFEVCKLLAAYLDGGVVELVPHETIRQNAALALRRGDSGSAIRHYEYLMSSGDFPLEVMSEAAAAHEANRDYGESATLLRRLAEEIVRTGDVAAAIVALHRVANYPRPEPEALRYLLELSFDHPKAVGEFSPSIIEAGKTLVAFHLNQEQFHDALALLGRLVEAFPDELAFADSLVNTYYDDGLAEKAISECERLAAGYLKRRRTTQAVSLYKKLLVLDPERSDIRDKIRKITNTGRRTTRSPGALPRIAVTLAIMLLLGGVALVMLRQEPGNVADASGIDHGTRKRLRERATTEQGSTEEHGTRATERFRKLVELLRTDAVARRDELMKVANDAQYSLEAFTTHHENLRSIARAMRLQAGLKEDAARSRELLATAKELEERVQVARETWRTKAQEAAERLHKQALEDYRAGEHRRALAALELAQDVATDDNWERFVGLDTTLSNIRGEIRGVEVKLANARDREEKADLIGARNLYMELLKDFRGSDLVRDLRLPVEVRTLPPGATIRVAGTDHPHKTPTVLRVSPFGQTEIEFSKPGFSTRSVKLGPFGDETDPAAFQFGWQVLKAPTWSTATNEVLEAAPASWNEHLVVAGRSGRWFVLDAKTGKQSGSGRLEADAAVTADLASSGSMVFIPSLNGTLFAVDAEAGKLVYRIPGRNQPIDAPPTTAGGVLYYVDHEGTATAFNLETRKSSWTKPSLPAVYAAPLVLGDRVVLLSTGGEVVVLSTANGETVKRFTLPGGTYRCAPAVIGEDLLFASEGGRLTRYDLRNDQVVWTEEWPVRVRRTPSISGGAIYVSPMPGELIVIDATAGRESYRFSNSLTVAGAAVSPNHRVFFAHDRTLSAFAPGKDGYGLAWSFEARSTILAGPVVHGSAVYIGDADGNIYRLEAVDE